MKKLILCLILVGLVGVVLAKPVIEKKFRKLDNKTLEVTTTTTDTVVTTYDKAVLQTELDHIPDRIAELEDQIDSLNERAIEIIDMLKVLQ